MLFKNKYRLISNLDYKVLGDLAFEIGEYNKAINNYKKQLNRMKENNYYDDVYDVKSIEGTYIEYELYEQIVKVYEIQKNYENAIEYVELMIKDDENKNVNKGDSFIKLANLYNLNNKKSEAIKILEDLLLYEKKQIEEEEKDDGLYHNNYSKQIYINTCYELIKLSQHIDDKKSIHYTNLALDLYNKNKNKDLGIKIASILEFQSQFYKNEIERFLKEKASIYDLSKENLQKIKCICENSILVSEIYLGDYECEKSKDAILLGIDTYEKYKLDDYKLEFNLKYQRAKVDSDTFHYKEDKEIVFNEYLEAFKILEQHDFFDEYKKNMILIELYYQCDDYEKAIEYKKQCDYHYIAEYKIKQSEKEKVAILKEYFDAAEGYSSCNNYDMAIKCYQKSMDNLITHMGIFGGEITEFEDENVFYDLVEKSYFGYEFYVKLCEKIASAYESKEDLDKQIEYLKKRINCLNKYYYADEFKNKTYNSYVYTIDDMAKAYTKNRQYKKAIDYELFLIAIYNSPNYKKSINDRFDDIEKAKKLLKEKQIKMHILSDVYEFDLQGEYINYIISGFERIIKIAKKLGDDNLIKIGEKKIKLLNDIPFDLDI